MRILVTGGAGFIGSHVVEALVDAGTEVVVLDALLPAAHGPEPCVALPEGVRLVRVDVRDRDAVDAALRGVDAVCHQAAMVGLGVDFDDAPEYVGCNGVGTAVLLAAMARTSVRALVLASSMVVYGEGRYRCARHGPVPAPPRRPQALRSGRFEVSCPYCDGDLACEPVTEDAVMDPRNVYAVTKLGQEQLAAVWARATGAHVAALRYHNVYGPRMPADTPYSGVAAIFRSALEHGEPPRVFEDGGQLRDFVHVEDIAAANVTALRWCLERRGERGVPRAFNVGSGTPHSVGELAAALAAACGGPAPRVTGEYRLGDVRHIVASSERLRTELGWRPTVGFARGMAEFADAPLRGAVPVAAGRNRS
jgi:dTDP-L-rhamnose 4-epimerase